MILTGFVILALLSCVSAQYEQCKKPVDILFVVEDSDALPQDAVANVTIFLANVANFFDIGPSRAQVAYLQYSMAEYSDIFFLNTFTEINDAKAAIWRTRFSLRSGTPSIASALNHTWDTHLTVTNGERSCSPSVVILLSFSSCDWDMPTCVDKFALDINAARQLKNSDVLIMALGIGPRRNPALLIELATNSSYYFDVDEFDMLSEHLANAVATIACNSVPDGVFYPCEMETVSADFTFVIDGSSTFDPATTGEWILTFIQNFLTPYRWGPYQWGSQSIEAGIQAALVPYAKLADISMNFGDAVSLDDFITNARISFANLRLGAPNATCIYDALDKIRNHVLDFSNFAYRPNCALRYIFIFTSGCFNCPKEDPIPYANAIRKEDAEIFVILTQPSPSFGVWKQPLDLADDIGHLYEAQTDPRRILTQDLHKHIWRHVCLNRGKAFCSRFPTTTPAS